jgi:hypothetical protein
MGGRIRGLFWLKCGGLLELRGEDRPPRSGQRKAQTHDNTGNLFGAVVQKHPCFNLEAPRNPRDVVNRDVSFRPLDAAEIGSIEAGYVGQRLLGQTTLRAEETHVPRQNVPKRSLVSLFHKGISTQ